MYGIKGVASQIPEGHAMNQRYGGTDDNEHEFANYQQRNQNATIAETRGTMAKCSGYQSINFARNLKSNSSGDKYVQMKELLAEVRHKGKVSKQRHGDSSKKRRREN